MSMDDDLEAWRKGMFRLRGEDNADYLQRTGTDSSCFLVKHRAYSAARRSSSVGTMPLRVMADCKIYRSRLSDSARRHCSCSFILRPSG